ncbi:uncharacterized protein LOC135114296 isoform X2 [Scylla paramamosain]|uniref:uncharacterized protein LOC135114296 isoform X2 n=1 Tax=Scylla paramamosain TaxID=85552 RepID=UPI00308325EF
MVYMLSRCLQKLREERTRGWIILPLWPSQPWMLVDDPRVIQRRKNVLMHPSTAEEHPIMKHTNLMACQLSGNNLENVAYLKKIEELTIKYELGKRRTHESDSQSNSMTQGIADFPVDLSHLDDGVPVGDGQHVSLKYP